MYHSFCLRNCIRYITTKGWATLVSYIARAVGIPARQAGTPCWNSVFEGVDFRGRASSNGNVSLCWHGGSAKRGHGGGFLNNHNWAEIYVNGEWAFVNVPPGNKEPDTGLCGAHFTSAQGCDFDPTAPKGHECAKITGSSANSICFCGMNQ